MKTVSQLLSALFMLTLLVTLSHCGSDDSDTPEDDNTDLTDPNAITEAITITGGTLVEGAPPATTTDPETPELDGADDLSTSQGGNPRLPLNTSSGSVAGAYVQIQGADSYFDIPASSFAGGRVAEGDPGIDIQLPEDIEPGEFCVDYCVYDAEARVSNVVTVCIVITSFGGENSDFLIGEWQVVSITESDSDGTETVVIGLDSFEDVFPVSLGCLDGTFEDFEAVETEFINSLQLFFSEEGSMLVQIDFSDRLVDLENSSCENGLAYVEEAGMDSFDGAWSYEDAASRLILVLDEEEDGENVLDWTIEVDGDVMTGVQSFGDGATDTFVLEKQ